MTDKQSELVEAVASDMMKADWADERETPPDAKIKNYYRMARAALSAIDGLGYVVVPREKVETVIEHAREGQDYLASYSDYTNAHRAVSAKKWADIDELEAMLEAALNSQRQ